MVEKRGSLAVVGCGRMGTAIVKGLHKSQDRIFSRLVFYDIDPGAARQLAGLVEGQVADSLGEAVREAGVILLAIKPQVITQITGDLAGHLSPDQLVISIAAGVSTRFLERELGQRVPVIRVMPNTPCLAGHGVSALCAGSHVLPGDEQMVSRMFSALGQVFTVHEAHMDAITAVSGCGPAYFLLVAESMIDAGVELGLPRSLVTDLVKNTLAGTAALWKETAEHPVLLREQVASPGGTTIAALRQLEEHGLRAAFFAALHRAWERSQELSRGLGKGVD